MSINIHLKKDSKNAKTGALALTTTTGAESCPETCMHKKAGTCYAMTGPQSWHWAKVTQGKYKNNLTSNIITHAVDNNMSHSTIQITDGSLKFQNTKVTSPLTFKFITECLNDCIDDPNQVKVLIDYIKKKREVKYVPEVKRSYTN